MYWAWALGHRDGMMQLRWEPLEKDAPGTDSGLGFRVGLQVEYRSPPIRDCRLLTFGGLSKIMVPFWVP